MLDTVFCGKVPVTCCCSDLVLPPLLRKQDFPKSANPIHFFVYRQKPIALTNKRSKGLYKAKIELSAIYFFNLNGCVGQDLPFLKLDFNPLL